MKFAALLDSNVLIAVAAEEHQFHKASIELLTRDGLGVLAVASHSYAEVYATLTRLGDHAQFKRDPSEAWLAIESIRSRTELVGLTPAQTYDAIRSYAASGGSGPRLYDRLIGETAVIFSIPVLITWNLRHMRSLFPQLRVQTPPEFLD